MDPNLRAGDGVKKAITGALGAPCFCIDGNRVYVIHMYVQLDIFGTGKEKYAEVYA